MHPSVCLPGVVEANTGGQVPSIVQSFLFLPSLRHVYPLPASQDPFIPNRRIALRQSSEGDREDGHRRALKPLSPPTARVTPSSLLASMPHQASPASLCPSTPQIKPLSEGSSLAITCHAVGVSGPLDPSKQGKSCNHHGSQLPACKMGLKAISVQKNRDPVSGVLS